MVESSGLLNRRRVKNSTGGSNPPLSAVRPILQAGCSESGLPSMVARAVLILLIASTPQIVHAESLPPLESGILADLNQLRTDPASYVPILQQRRRQYRGKLLERPGEPDLLTEEGVRPLDEAIRALRSLHADIGRVALSAGLSRAAMEHVRDTGELGLVGHAGADGSAFEKRIEHAGTWSGEIGEVISYGARDARDVILGLLVDDGVADRGHRTSVVNPRWRFVGIACGIHARYGIMCVIDFASNFQDR